VHTKAFSALIILTVLWLLPILQCLSALLNTFYVQLALHFYSTEALTSHEIYGVEGFNRKAGEEYFSVPTRLEDSKRNFCLKIIKRELEAKKVSA
jgi:hypothetical protein